MSIAVVIVQLMFRQLYWRKFMGSAFEIPQRHNLTLLHCFLLPSQIEIHISIYIYIYQSHMIAFPLIYEYLSSEYEKEHAATFLFSFYNYLLLALVYNLSFTDLACACHPDSIHTVTSTNERIKKMIFVLCHMRLAVLLNIKIYSSINFLENNMISLLMAE